MHLKNLTLVLAPNMFGPSGHKDANPLQELVLVECAANALVHLASSGVAGE